MNHQEVNTILSQLKLREIESSNPILIYDGDCGLCDFAVQFILRHEKDASIHFLASGEIAELTQSLVFIYQGQVYYKSEAALQIAQFLKSPINFLVILRFLPRSLRDWLYEQIAKNRRKIWAKPSCSLEHGKLAQGQSHRFLQIPI